MAEPPPRPRSSADVVGTGGRPVAGVPVVTGSRLGPGPLEHAGPGAREAEGRLDLLDRRVIQLFALVREAIAGAASALLAGDRGAAHELVLRDAEIDGRSRGIIERMGAVASEMWRMAADAYGDATCGAPGALDALDDDLDDDLDELHLGLAAKLASASTAGPVVIEIVLVASCYEQLGDHALNITGRIPDLSGVPGWRGVPGRRRRWRGGRGGSPAPTSTFPA